VQGDGRQGDGRRAPGGLNPAPPAPLRPRASGVPARGPTDAAPESHRKPRTTMSEPTPSRPAPADDPEKARAAVRAGVLAYFVDQFDIYLPIVVLAPATAYFQSTDLDPQTSAILTALVFASTLIARPLGAAVFGHFADTTGRKKTTLVAVAGFGITTLLIACLPGYASIGLWSVGLLIALRFVDGFFLGGE